MSRKSLLPLAMLGAIVALSLSGQAANAQATRTWVSGVGNDADPCSRTAPCKTFAGAISKTAAGGEINCLDSGGFGAVTITKSLTIACEGVIGGVLSSGTNAIIVNAAATDLIVLRGLDIEGLATSLVGVNVLSAKSVLIENSIIRNFRSGTAAGVATSGAVTLLVTVRNVTLANNGTAVNVANTGGFKTVNVINSLLLGSTSNGITVPNNSTFVNVADSVIATGTSNGVLNNGASSVVSVDRSQISSNTGSAFNAGVSGAVINVSGNKVCNNTTAFTFVAGATIATDHLNKICAGQGATNPNANINLQ